MERLAVESELTLGHYQLGSRLGAGAIGSVYAAVDVRSGQQVVVKFFDGQEEGFSPWASEMRLALRLRHPNIATCLDVGFDERQQLWALVFTRAQGGSLRRALVLGRRFSERKLAQLLLDIASALAYAHAHGVVHRDVKPENIVAQVDDEATAWLLTDFGAGRFLVPGEVARSVAGSLEYMAPEVTGAGATAASDQFSLGILGMELLLGRLPGSQERPDLARSLRRGSGLHALIGRLADPDPSKRFPDMAAVASRLQQELTEMKNGDDPIASLRRYLEERHGLSVDAQLDMIRQWGQQGSFASFLASRDLLPRATARSIEAVQNGYLDMAVDSLLGLTKPPIAAQRRTDPGEALPPAPPAEPTLSRPVAASAPRPPAAAAISRPPDAAPAPTESARQPELGQSQRSLRTSSGQRLGRYVLHEPLGEGATATVFRSFHEMLSIPVAIKVFAPIDAAEDPDARDRFRREAQTLVRLDHPNVVRVLDVDIVDQVPYIVMEYVGETTVATQIRNFGKLPAVRIAQIGIAVADALQAAAQEGLLHRDVKPSNIIERRDGHIKLVDFGIAAQRTPQGTLGDPLAQSGLVSGTPDYLAPEQAQEPDRIDFRADMYGLGASLYHAAVGRPPFSRPTVHDMIRAHIEEEPTQIELLNPGFDPHLARTIHRMLRKRREERFASWAEVKAALAQVLEEHDQPEVSLSAASEEGERSTAITFQPNSPASPLPAAAAAPDPPAETPAGKAAPEPPRALVAAPAPAAPAAAVQPLTPWQLLRQRFDAQPLLARLGASVAGILLLILLAFLLRLIGGVT